LGMGVGTHKCLLVLIGNEELSPSAALPSPLQGLLSLKQEL
jgi:hypothetical protein